MKPTLRQSSPEILFELLTQLTAFGLDPQDWWIAEASGHAKIEMRHREEYDLKLEAAVRQSRNGRHRLRGLTLAAW
jgi:hypothetical protein